MTHQANSLFTPRGRRVEPALNKLPSARLNLSVGRNGATRERSLSRSRPPSSVSPAAASRAARSQSDGSPARPRWSAAWTAARLGGSSHRPVGQPLTVIDLRVYALIERHVVYGRVVTLDPGACPTESRSRSTPARTAPSRSASAPGSSAPAVQQAAASGSKAFSPPPRSRAGSEAAARANTAPSPGLPATTSPASPPTSQTAKPNRSRSTTTPTSPSFPAPPFPLASSPTTARARSSACSRRTPSTASSPLPPRGRPALIKSVRTPSGGYIALYTGPSSTGGTCTYIKWQESKTQGGIGEGCAPMAASSRKSQLFLESMGNPGFMVTGRAPTGTTTVVLHYADGTTTTTRPVRGYIVYAIPGPGTNKPNTNSNRPTPSVPTANTSPPSRSLRAGGRPAHRDRETRQIKTLSSPLATSKLKSCSTRPSGRKPRPAPRARAPGALGRARTPSIERGLPGRPAARGSGS
jgi:hypothetical protein